MSVIYSQNFDGLTPPALPTGWTFSSGSWITSASQFNSSPNSLQNAASGSVETATINTSDGNGGDADLAVAIRISASSGNDEAFVGVRCSNSAADGYFTAVQIGPSDPKGLTIYKRVSGTLTALHATPVGATNFTTATWYIPEVEAVGTTISAYCQRVSDSKWMQTDGSWGSTRTAATSVTDSSISGTGKAGLIMFISTGQINWDDVVYSTAGAGSATTYTLSGPSTCSIGHPSAPFTVTPNGTSTNVITPSDGATGGTFSPTNVTFSGSGSKTFTYTAASSGTHTISTTNNGSLTNPASVSIKAGTAVYVVTHASNRTFYEIIRDSNGNAYKQTSGAFVSFASSNWTAIARQLGEQTMGSGYSEYSPPGFPVTADGGVAGTYSIQVYQQSGTSAAITDQPPSDGVTVYWNGSQETQPSSGGGGGGVTASQGLTGGLQ